MHNLKYLVLLLVLGVFLASCEKDDTSVIDPILNYPTISDAQFSPVTFDSDTINAVGSVVVTSVDPLGSVNINVTDPKGTFRTFTLHDDGVAPDVTAGDGKFTGNVFYVMDCRIVGPNGYKAEFIAQTVKGLKSNAISQLFSVTNSNSRNPVISGLLMPDSAKFNVVSDFSFKLIANDPDGLCDVREVFYTGFKPNGVALTRLDLFDDGSCCLIPPNNVISGDEFADDGIYTRIVSGPPDQLGYYRYFFRAVDRSGDTSNVIADSIYVYP